MKILITGCCGFVGQKLLSFFARQTIKNTNVEVFGLDNLSRPGSEIHRLASETAAGVRFVHGDLRLASDVESLPAVDWVIDASANPSVLAGSDGRTSSRQLIEHNLLSTVNLLEYCKQHQAGFVLLSSSRVYSISHLRAIELDTRDCRFTPRDDSLQHGIAETFSTEPPLSLYGTTKRTSEYLALEYGNAFGLPVFINRCGLIAGAGQFCRVDQGFVAFWIHSWIARQRLSYFGFGGNGHQVRDALHPDDLAELLLLQISESPGGDAPCVINVGGGSAQSFSLAELSQWCESELGPHSVDSSPKDREFDVPWLVLNGARVENDWSWKPRRSLDTICNEIAQFARRNPDWLQLTCSTDFQSR